MIVRAAAVLAAVVSLVAAAPSGAPAGNAAKGGRDFIALGCSACHGTTGAGGGWQGPKLAPDPIPFAAFLGQLREPADKMPRYSKAVLTDAEAVDLHAYLRSIPRGRRAAEIEILNR